jgi:hypothetical protein
MIQTDFRNSLTDAKVGRVTRMEKLFIHKHNLNGGGRGIRTPGALSSTTVFKTAGFNRSPIPPRGGACSNDCKAIEQMTRVPSIKCGGHLPGALLDAVIFRAQSFRRVAKL